MRLYQRETVSPFFSIPLAGNHKRRRILFTRTLRRRKLGSLFSEVLSRNLTYSQSAKYFLWDNFGRGLNYPIRAWTPECSRIGIVTPFYRRKG